MKSTEVKLIEVTESIAGLVERVKQESTEAPQTMAPAAVAKTATANQQPANSPHSSADTALKQPKKTSRVRLGTATAVVASLIVLVAFQGKVSALLNPDTTDEEALHVQHDAAPVATPSAVVMAAADNQSNESKDSTAQVVAQRDAEAQPIQNNEVDVKETAVQQPAPTATTPTHQTLTTAEPLVVAAPLPKTPPPASDTLRRGDWILAQPGHLYTLQIAALQNERALLKFIEANNLADRTAYFQFSRNDKNIHVAVLDMFEEPGKARQALKQLPPAIAEMKPWVRQLSSIQKIIASN